MRCKRFCAAALVLVGLLLAVQHVAAQDAHYWTLQYGPRSSLLGGAVIGSVEDISATYYNPGALALASDLTFAITANVFERSGISLEGGGGEGVNLGTSQSGLRPSLLAGTLKRGVFGSGVLAYSALTRVKGTQDFSGVVIQSGSELDPSLQLQDRAASVQFEGEFSDFWAGISYSQPFGSHFGLGVTWYAAFRSQRRRAEAVNQSIATDGTGFVSLDIRGGEYSTTRTLAKFGAFAAVGPFSGGLTVTTPSIHISGSGQLAFNTSTVSPDTAALASSVQTDLPAEFKSPLSVGAGGALRIGKTRLHASAEWFEATAPYVVIQGEDFVSQAPAQVVPVDAVQELAEVLNWGAGLEHAISPSVSAYASYSTDNSGLSEDIERAGLSALPLDISLISAGSDFVLGPARFTLGLGYAWGRKVDQALTDVLQQEDPNFEAVFVYRSIRVIFGFEIGIN
ncbi:MAG: hypothetical protein O7I93_07175 [Gemmatimonadetes bacterium]|nr:hypothetical protein [Gemmatimonadota bacterium]